MIDMKLLYISLSFVTVFENVLNSVWDFSNGLDDVNAILDGETAFTFLKNL